MHAHGLAPFLVAILAGCLTLACTTGPDPEPASGARQGLAAEAARGPVPIEVRGAPVGLGSAERDALVAEAMAAGVRGMQVRFTTAPDAADASGRRLVVVLDPAGVATAGAACRAAQDIPTAPASGKLSILGVWCEGPEPVAEARAEGPVTGPDDRAVQRLLWRTAGELFPDDYAETYGFGILPDWLRIGVGGSVGF